MARRPKVSNKMGFPHRNEGSDGDTQVRQTGIGARLFAKLGGRWFSNALHGNEINNPDIFLPKAWHKKGTLPSIYTGTHTGSNNQDGTASNPLVDSAASFTTDALIGTVIRNMTSGYSSGTITDNDGTTITCSGGLSGGGGNDWDTNDKYIINEDEIIHLPSNINKENILGVSFGVSIGAGIYTYMGLGGMDQAADGTGTVAESGTADSAISIGELGTFNPSASRYAMFVHYHHADLDLSGYLGGKQQYDNSIRIEISSEADAIAGKNYKLTVFFK